MPPERAAPRDIFSSLHFPLSTFPYPPPVPERSPHAVPPRAIVDVDACIIGGGIAGLWTLDALTRAGFRAVLIERTALGDGQSIWSQGIIHSGLKYTLTGSLTPAAKAIRDMPERWNAALAGTAGESGPDLRAATVRSPHCWLWQTASLTSRAGMIGARAGLRIAPVVVPPEDRPEALRDCPGTVARLDEPVIDVASVIGALGAAHADRIFRADIGPGDLHPGSLGFAQTVRASEAIAIRPRWIVIAAGNGGEKLRAMFGASAKKMQVRPLRMVMVRGSHPMVHGHCVDGSATRVTITSAKDAGGRTVWQVGGDLAERGATMDPDELIALAHAELAAVLPGVDLSRCEFSTYEAPRAEAKMRFGARPVGPEVIIDQRIITVWPTKLALAPIAADIVVHAVSIAGVRFDAALPELPEAPRPSVAAAPWDDPRAAWTPSSELGGR